MTKQRRNSSRAIAVFLAFALVQICIQLSFAAPASGTVVVPQQFIARLTTTGNQPITVNGASASSGATLLTGATIETPAAVSATIDLGALGTVELQPNSSIQLDFDDNGNVRVKVLRGCVVMRKSGGGVGEIYTAEGASEKTNNNRKGLGFCFLNGGLNPISQTAATGGVAGGEGIGTEAIIAILAGGGALAAGLIWAFHGGGGNPSPS
ncbi:MAG TPA: hypothetical protein VK208_15715 [Pyrinomonadaceae bacterium]|jgi:hypothetical protein|nr:hypothetical protein [Pyrinomonadaceae bacterium]